MKIAFILFALSSGAQAEDVDLKNLPEMFCKPVLQVSEETRDCPGNTTFMQAAQECMDKLNSLEKRLGAEAIAIASKNKQSQLGELATGGREYQFSAAALAHLEGVALVAQKQLKSYPNFVFLPPDPPHMQDENDRLRLAETIPCYRDSQAKIREAQKFFADKIARFQQRRIESQAKRTRLDHSTGDFNSLSERRALAGRRDIPLKKTIPKKKNEASDSDITGVNRKTPDLFP